MSMYNLERKIVDFNIEEYEQVIKVNRNMSIQNAKYKRKVLNKAYSKIEIHLFCVN